MIKGFVVTAITQIGEEQLNKQGKIPLMAKSLIRKQVVSKAPLSVEFVFKKKFIDFLLRSPKKKGRKLPDPETWVEILCKEMKCEKNVDYTLDVIEDE